MVRSEAGSEFARIAEITSLLSDDANDLSQPYKTLIGDDAAVIDFQDLRITLFASDMMVENIHFRTSYCNEAEIGYKAMATNVSDMAAMAGYPRYATISLACPKTFSIRDFYTGVKEACDEYTFHIAGGDLSACDIVVVSVAMIGTCYDQPVYRATAQPGDYIFATGPLGASAAGLKILQENPKALGTLVERHKRPRAKLREALGAARARVTSMIDVSDGLVADLHHICESSSVGAELQEIPVADGATLEAALYGGEDYELIFSHPEPAAVYREFQSLGLTKPYLLGKLNNAGGLKLRGQEIEIRGYEHDL